MTIMLDLPTELEDHLQSVARVQGKDFNTFLIEGLRQQLRTDILPLSETMLLEAINAPIAPDAKHRRDELLRIRTVQELNDKEENELSQLIDEVELANAHKWRSISMLADLRGKSLRELASELQIPLK